MQPDKRPRTPRRRVVGLDWDGAKLACGHTVDAPLRPSNWRRGLTRKWPKHLRRACRECKEARDEA